jgi:Arc/MetJ family transcription regulator
MTPASGRPRTIPEEKVSGIFSPISIHRHGKLEPDGQSLMRTNIVLDDDLVAEAMRRTGIKTKRAVVEEAPKTLIGLKRQEEILALRGKLRWEGDLDEMRRD